MPKNNIYTYYFQIIRTQNNSRGGENLNSRETKIKIVSNLSEVMQARTEWSEMFKVL